MKRFSLLVLAAVIAATIFAGCTKAEPQPSGEPDVAVAVVGGAEIMRSEVESLAAHSDKMYESLTGVSEEEIAEKKLESRLTILENLVTERIISSKIEEYGIKETKQMREAAEKSWENAVSAMEKYVLASYPTLEGSELEETVNAMLNTQGISEETLIKSAIQDELEKALAEELKGEAPPAEEAEISEYYSSLLEKQKVSFTADTAAFEGALMSGETVVFRPADCRVVKQLYLKFDEEVIGLIKQLEAVDDTETADEMRNDQYRILNKKLETIRKDLDSGEKFDTILEENEQGSSAGVNYITEASERFSEEYKRALFALTEQGTYSEPVKQEYGYVILFWQDTLKAGESSFEEVRESIEKLLTEENDRVYYEEQLKQWRSDAEVELFTENLK